MKTLIAMHEEIIGTQFTDIYVRTSRGRHCLKVSEHLGFYATILEDLGR